MAVTVSQPKKRQDGDLVSIPVAASKKILGGTLVFLDAAGRATDVKVDANTVFAGIASEEADNSSGSAGDINVEVETCGTYELPSGSLALADVGATIYATDNYTTTKTSSTNPTIGKLVEFVSATVGRIAIAGLGRSAG